jgi:hypothetical protein
MSRTVAARFTNSSRDDLEGTFSLQLPEIAVVTGYALDVDGQMIDGVLVPPRVPTARMREAATRYRSWHRGGQARQRVQHPDLSDSCQQRAEPSG